MTPLSPVDGATPLAAVPDLSFTDLGLPRRLVAALERAGLTTPFPVQASTIPDALDGRDVLGRGRTGSGKTLAFGLPVLTLAARRGGRARVPGSPYALILAPTRELATQVHDALRPYARELGLEMATAVGGEPYGRQIRALERGVHVLVATPGRLGDLVRRGVCDLARVQITVLDEADQMADTGFLPEVCDILDAVDPQGQRLLFSATLDDRVQAVIDRFLTEPVEHSADPVGASVPDMAHHVLAIAPRDKRRVVAEIAGRPGRTIMFVRSRAGAERVAEQLGQEGLRAEALHGGKSQGQRTRAIEAFRRGRTPVLVATDVAARGIHVDGVDLVLHVDPTDDHRDYLHRAGRTARAGAGGTVVTLALPHQMGPVRSMLRRAGVEAPAQRVEPGSHELVSITAARNPEEAAAEFAAAEAARPARRERPAGQFERPRHSAGAHGARNRSRSGPRGGERRPAGTAR